MFNTITDIFYIIAGVLGLWVMNEIRKNTSKKKKYIIEEYHAQLNDTLIALEKIINSILDNQIKNNELMREVINLAKRK